MFLLIRMSFEICSSNNYKHFIIINPTKSRFLLVHKSSISNHTIKKELESSQLVSTSLSKRCALLCLIIHVYLLFNAQYTMLYHETTGIQSGLRLPRRHPFSTCTGLIDGL